MRHRGHRLGRGLVALVAAVALIVTGARYAGAADGGSFTPTATWTWTDGTSLGTTPTAAQTVTATTNGLTDSDHNAGFRLRTNTTGNILVAVSGTSWKIEPSGGGTRSGTTTLPATGTLRIDITTTNQVTITYNGTVITTQTITGTYDGRGITPTAWQSTTGVSLTGITSNTGSDCTGTPGAPFTPTATWTWTDGTSLGTTPTAAQTVTATTNGLTDSDHNAGFRLRTNTTGNILVAVSGTSWKIEPSGGGTRSGTTTLPATGTLRIDITTTNQVTITYNGTVITTQTITGTYDGRGITPTAWQSTTGVSLTGITSNTGSDCTPTTPPGTTPPTSTPPTTTPPTSPPPTGSPTWISGAASQYAADGSFGTWRGEPVGIGGTWDDSKEAQTALYSISVGDWKDWTGPIDEAIGAIYEGDGETWAQAAAGAYDSRWTTALTTLKSKWGSRNPANLYVRFAHEMNLSGSDWSVRPGEEAAFRTALTRFSTLRYSIIPQMHLVLCPNDGTGTGIDVRDLFVAQDGQGRPVVDVYSTDSYNQYPHRTDYNDITASFRATEGNGAPLGIEAHRAYAQSVGVPFAVSEWGNCGLASQCDGGGGEAPAYVRAFNDWARAHAGDIAHPVAGQLLYEVQFNLWDRFLLYPQSSQPSTASAYAALVWGH